MEEEGDNTNTATVDESMDNPDDDNVEVEGVRGGEEQAVVVLDGVPQQEEERVSHLSFATPDEREQQEEEEEGIPPLIGNSTHSVLGNSTHHSTFAVAEIEPMAAARNIEETNVPQPPSFPPSTHTIQEEIASTSSYGSTDRVASSTTNNNSSSSTKATTSGASSTFYQQSILRQQQQQVQQLSPSSLSNQHRSTSFPSVYASSSFGGIRGRQEQSGSTSNTTTANRTSAWQPEQAMVGEETALAYNSNSSGWSVVDTTQGVPPSARSLHAASLLNGILYVFGGYDGSQRVNTFHAFSFADKRWSPVLPSANSSGPPSPRDRHVAVAFGNSFYVHGGFDGTSRVSDFWAFDFSSMTWREVLAVQGRPPSPRHSHAAVVHGHSLYVYGGYDGSYKSDLHEYDFTTFRWNQVATAGRRPRPRYRATCVVHKNTMILYGGHDGTRHLSDSFMFDFDTRTWTALLTEGIQPIPRDSHVSVIHGNSMYVFGGSSGSAMNDLHELQLPSSTGSPSAKWRPVKISGAEQPRHRFCHTAVAFNESMFIFGGYDGSERLNDFIKFDFAVHDLSFEVPSSTIISDLGELINDETLSDVTFIVDDRPVYAHKLMLMRCSYFRALFLGEMRESKLSSIRIEQVSYPIFLAILEYLYTDQVLIPFDSAMNLFEAADLFCIPRLKTMCEKCMLQSINVENAASIFHAADMHSATALRQKAKKYILYHFEDVSKTSTFEEMGRSNIELVFELLHSR